MPTKEEVEALLDELEERCADNLENQHLDFKEWNTRSYRDSGALVQEMAICLANGGGGTLVIGVRDNIVGRQNAILGVPANVDMVTLQTGIYQNTDPRLTPVFEELFVSEGTGRLILMQVHRGLPMYTDRSGGGKIRVGKNCEPLTGSIRQDLLAASADADFLNEIVSGDAHDLLSAAGMEQLRTTALRETAPKELIGKSDIDLLSTLNLVRDGQLTRGGLLFVGKEERIAEEFPSYGWSYLRMKSGSDYDDRADGRDCIAIALRKIEDSIRPNNPLSTIQQGLLHFEYRTFPEIALREALVNSFVHADYRIPGIVQLKQFDDRLEIANPGGLIGGVSPSNILRHTPIARNAAMAKALIQLRLVNRSNIGMHRMFEAMLLEGKEPPIIRDAGNSVRVIFLVSEFSFAFRSFVAEVSQVDGLLTLEEMLVMQYLIRHDEITESVASEICQQEPREIKETLRRMVKRKIIQTQRRNRLDVWMLRPEVESRLSLVHIDDTGPSKTEIALSRIIDALKERHEVDGPGLTNEDLRNLTGLDRDQIKYVMKKLRAQGVAKATGRGRGAKWQLVAEETRS